MNGMNQKTSEALMYVSKVHTLHKTHSRSKFVNFFNIDGRWTDVILKITSWIDSGRTTYRSTTSTNGQRRRSNKSWRLCRKGAHPVDRTTYIVSKNRHTSFQHFSIFVQAAFGILTLHLSIFLTNTFFTWVFSRITQRRHLVYQPVLKRIFLPIIRNFLPLNISLAFEFTGW